MNMKSDNLIEGEIADYVLESSGILVSYSKPVRRTVENIARNIALVQSITHHKPAPLLIFLSKSPVPDKATRKFSSEQLPFVYKAMAMVSKPGLSALIMRLLFQFQNPPIPMKSFTNEIEAREWLKKYVN
ncbi:DUF7793 family protein [Aquirufa sp. ROCK-SH2]